MSQQDTAKVVRILIEDIEASLFECRDGSDLTELTRSIEKVGVMEPIIVRPKINGKYELVAGGRRVNASKAAGLKDIPAVIRELSEEEAFIFQVSENLQRVDLTDQEKTKLVVYCAEKYKWTPKEIAQKISMSLDWVYKYLPTQYKNQVRAEAGKVGGETTQKNLLDAVKQTVNTSDTKKKVICPKCGQICDSEMDYNLFHWRKNHYGPIPKPLPAETPTPNPQESPQEASSIEPAVTAQEGKSAASHTEEEKPQKAEAEPEEIPPGVPACPCCGCALDPKEYQQIKAAVAKKYGRQIQTLLFSTPQNKKELKENFLTH